MNDDFLRVSTTRIKLHINRLLVVNIVFFLLVDKQCSIDRRQKQIYVLPKSRFRRTALSLQFFTL